MLKPHCRVIRDGRMQDIDATLLVPGDIVLLDSGDSVPADLRLIDAVNLKADEATLTGESAPVDKDTEPVPENTHITARTCMTWMGTHIVNGRGQGIVTATGMNTEFGRIAGLTGKIQETETRLQKQLSILAKQLTILVIFVTGIVVFAGWLGGRPLLQMAMAGISLSVAAVPEGLPAVVTITLALGMRAMARRKALLRHLQTAETLGATSVICTDKTGTLTKNEMTIHKLWLGIG
jgi:Ca2+-transporting ATPase